MNASIYSRIRRRPSTREAVNFKKYDQPEQPFLSKQCMNPSLNLH